MCPWGQVPSCVSFLLEWVSIPVRRECDITQTRAPAVCQIRTPLLTKDGPQHARLLGGLALGLSIRVRMGTSLVSD